MTPDSLLLALRTLPSAAPLTFQTDAGPIGKGYHVTELKLAHVTGIDCAARMAHWTEAAIQLLDGSVGDQMTVGTFIGILDQSIRNVDGLGPAPLKIEFAHGNDGMHLFLAADPILEDGRVLISLGGAQATCKPAASQACCAPIPDQAASQNRGCCA